MKSRLSCLVRLKQGKEEEGEGGRGRALLHLLLVLSLPSTPPFTLNSPMVVITTAAPVSTENNVVILMLINVIYNSCVGHLEVLWRVQ